MIKLMLIYVKSTKRQFLAILKGKTTAVRANNLLSQSGKLFACFGNADCP